MMKVCYSELDGPEGLSCRLEAAGHAGFAPAGQDIVCAGASTLMQALVYLLAGEENAHADAWEEPDGPRLAVQADAPCAAWVQGAFELAKAGFALLAERYPKVLMDSYKLPEVPAREGEENDIAYGYRLLQVCAQKRGMRISGGEFDTERMSRVLLDEYRAGKLGRFTLEMPQD